MAVPKNLVSLAGWVAVLSGLAGAGGCGQAMMSAKLKDFEKAFDTSLVLATESLPPASMGKPYSAALVARGEPGPYRWRVAAGKLPPGLALDPKGRLRGIPATSGEASFVVEVACDKPPARDEDSRSPYVASRSRRLKLFVQGAPPPADVALPTPAATGGAAEPASGGLRPAAVVVPAGPAGPVPVVAPASAPVAPPAP